MGTKVSLALFTGKGVRNIGFYLKMSAAGMVQWLASHFPGACAAMTNQVTTEKDLIDGRRTT